MEDEKNWHLNSTINSGNNSDMRYGGFDLVDIDGDDITDFICNDYFWGESKNGTVCISFGRNHDFKNIRNTSIDLISDLVFIGSESDQLMYLIRDINSDGNIDLQLNLHTKVWIFYSSTLANLSGTYRIDSISPDLSFSYDDDHWINLEKSVDLNMDGMNDFIFTGWHRNENPVIFGKKNLSQNVNVNRSIDIMITKSDWHWEFMNTCDFNNDGYVDFVLHYINILGNLRHDPIEIQLMIAYGFEKMSDDNIQLDTLENLTIKGYAHYNAERRVLVEDINLDGKDDIAFYNSEKDNNTTYRKYWYILLGCNITGKHNFDEIVNLRLTSMDNDHGVGGISFIDLNNDGRKDIALTGTGRDQDEKGNVLIILGREGLFNGNDIIASSINYTIDIHGNQRSVGRLNWGSGYRIHSTVDVDGDQREDIIVEADLDINQTIKDRTGCVILYSDHLLQIEEISSLISYADEFLSVPYGNGPFWNDTDNDGIRDILDLFPEDPTEWNDTDLDGWGDNRDIFPEDPTEWNDTDEDGWGDNRDHFPEDPTEWNDTDEDGYGDNRDEFPENATEWLDSDNDGVGDNTDWYPFDPSEWLLDSDQDGYPDVNDTFPFHMYEWVDSDGDGFGDNGDIFPDNPTEWNDTDEDGVGDNGDAFSNDPSASIDTDGDGYPDSWNPGMSEADSTTGLKLDEYPNDPNKWLSEEDSEGFQYLWFLILLFVLVIIAIITIVVIAKKRKPDQESISKEE